MPHVYRVVDGDPGLGVPEKEALNYLMTIAYDAYVEVQRDGKAFSGGGVSEQAGLLDPVSGDER